MPTMTRAGWRLMLLPFSSDPRMTSTRCTSGSRVAITTGVRKAATLPRHADSCAERRKRNRARRANAPQIPTAEKLCFTESSSVAVNDNLSADWMTRFLKSLKVMFDFGSALIVAM